MNIPGTELRLGHSAVFSHVHQIVNSKDFESYSFVVPKYAIPEDVFVKRLPCLYHASDEKDVYSYRKLIHDACKQVELLFTQHRELRQSIVHNIQNRIDAAEALLPRQLPQSDRSTRALMGGVSYITKFLFGIPSEGDFRRINARVKTLSHELSEQGALLDKVRQGFSLMTNVTMSRLERLERQQASGRERLDSLIDNLRVWREGLRRTIKDAQVTSMATGELMGFMSLFHQLTTSEVLILATMEQEAAAYFGSLQLLTEGKLPRTLVGPDQVRKALEVVAGKLSSTSGQMISHQDVAYYYKHKLVLAMHDERYVVINIKIPVNFMSAEMKLYQLNVFPVPHENNTDSGFKIVQNVPQYFAVSMEGQYYSEITAEQVKDCLPHHCHVTFPIHTYIRKSCVLAMFNSNHDAVLKHCLFSYTYNVTNAEMAQDLGHGYLILRSATGWVMTRIAT